MVNVSTIQIKASFKRCETLPWNYTFVLSRSFTTLVFRTSKNTHFFSTMLCCIFERKVQYVPHVWAEQSYRSLSLPQHCKICFFGLAVRHIYDSTQILFSSAYRWFYLFWNGVKPSSNYFSSSYFLLSYFTNLASKWWSKMCQTRNTFAYIKFNNYDY